MDKLDANDTIWFALKNEVNFLLKFMKWKKKTVYISALINNNNFHQKMKCLLISALILSSILCVPIDQDSFLQLMTNKKVEHLTETKTG